jgi:hypothetical protein
MDSIFPREAACVCCDSNKFDIFKLTHYNFEFHFEISMKIESLSKQLTDS